MQPGDFFRPLDYSPVSCYVDTIIRPKGRRAMSLIREIERYQPCCEQEEKDQEVMLRFIRENDDCLLRSNLLAHFSASVWVVNPPRTKVLMAYHNLYDSWAWIGGHADGEADLRAVAMRELQEETGVRHARLVSDDVFSLERCRYAATKNAARTCPPICI